MKEKEIKIRSKEFWVNIVDFLQQYWALIEESDDTAQVTVYFIHEGSGVFSNMKFKSKDIATKALMQNGFKKFDDPLENFETFLSPPIEPYYTVQFKSGDLMAS
jgi:hypothetical protein